LQFFVFALSKAMLARAQRVLLKRPVIHHCSLYHHKIMLSTMTVAQTIESKLTASLSPIHLDVINESHMHNV
jgi:hypothetical protein